MRFASDRFDSHVASIAQQAERYGIVLDLPDDGPVTVEVERTGDRRFDLVGFLPDGRQPALSTIRLTERWRRVAPDLFERHEYAYELLDHERDLRRAFHRHDDAAFVRTFGVVVHEHCESPIGQSACGHHHGRPVKDGFQAVELLMRVWIDEQPDCADLPCLEAL